MARQYAMSEKLSPAARKATQHADVPGAGAKKRKGVPAKEKAGVVMREFYHGKLRSGSGQKVTKPAQAKAIAMSEQRRAQGKKH